MLNQAVLVGRVVKIENEVMTLAVPRNFKNGDGIYEFDCIPCVLWKGIADSVKNNCKKNDFVGIKGWLSATNNKLKLIAEKITYFSTKEASNNE